MRLRTVWILCASALLAVGCGGSQSDRGRPPVDQPTAGLRTEDDLALRVLTVGGGPRRGNRDRRARRPATRAARGQALPDRGAANGVSKANQLLWQRVGAECTHAGYALSGAAVAFRSIGEGAASVSATTVAAAPTSRQR